ncbi:hypothetical protein [Kordia jejudonensis]|uniref:hypothetical protein n=1 Tax=Kordia jejudonensis TaxID=1348245 RepID=UPI0006297041|nr:hypothetical protein [Kordia jejudonensis]
MITFGFFGSSSDSIALKHNVLVDSILIQIFQKHNSVRIITGGYDGFMKTICQRAKQLVASKYKDVYLETYGILYSGFSESPNSYLDKTINTSSIGERVQTVIELSDFLFGMPGSNGTYHEILQAIEVIKYPSPNHKRLFFNNLYVSSFWKDKLEMEELQFFDTTSELNFKEATANISVKKELDKNTVKDSLIEQIKKIICHGHESKDDILAFDFAFTLFNEEHGINVGKNTSRAIDTYQDVIQGYLKTKPSLLNYDTGFRDYDSLDCKLYKGKNLKLSQYEIDISKETKDKNQKNIQFGFEDWNRYLKSNGFGKISFWVNETFQFDKIRVNLSCFLILNVDLPKHKCDHILLLLEQYILSNGLQELVSQIKKFLITTKELTSFKDYATSHKHTIKNYEFRYSLATLLKYLPSEDQYAMELLENINNTLIIRDLASQLFYSFDRQNSKDVYEKFKIKSLSGLIMAIHKSSSLAFKDEEHLKLDLESFSNHMCNTISSGDFLDVFNIVSNLYSNTRKHSDDKEFFITVDSSDKKKLIIEFRTLSDMAKPFVDYLNGKKEIDLNYHKGFKQIKHSEKKLNYIDIDAKSNVKETIIKLIVNENTNNRR